jgi:EAL and modified HD-GYP domain-containing signal transduction protein
MKPSSRRSVFVGRQQIFDRDLNVIAYELLFRSSNENRATFADEDIATSQLLVNSLVEIGLENLVFCRPAYVNFTTSFIVGKRDIPFHPNQLVIEVQENIKPDPRVVSALVDLRKAGYTIAMGGYVETDKRNELLGLMDIVKFDLRAFHGTQLSQKVAALKKLPIKLLAEKVETTEQFHQCKELGFDYFQGYVLSRPQVVEGTTIANNKSAINQLLIKLSDPFVTFDEVVDLIKQDVSLSLKLFRYANSLAEGFRRQIASVRQAAVFLGLEKIQQIVALIATSDFSDSRIPLLETALIRAKMCEILGGPSRSEIAESFYTILEPRRVPRPTVDDDHERHAAIRRDSSGAGLAQRTDGPLARVGCRLRTRSVSSGGTTWPGLRGASASLFNGSLVGA